MKSVESLNAPIIAKAKQAAGITEPVSTWDAWYASGFLVQYGQAPLFTAKIFHKYLKPGERYNAKFFGRSQVIPHPCMIQRGEAI